MLDLNKIYEILSTFGPWGLILIVLIYIVVKGQIAFRYPRREDRAKRNSRG
jgi:hypothetical protein